MTSSYTGNSPPSRKHSRRDNQRQTTVDDSFHMLVNAYSNRENRLLIDDLLSDESEFTFLARDSPNKPVLTRSPISGNASQNNITLGSFLQTPPHSPQISSSDSFQSAKVPTLPVPDELLEELKLGQDDSNDPISRRILQAYKEIQLEKKQNKDK